MLIKCPCNTCSAHLEFDEPAVGSTVVCPHCGVDTVLFIPQDPTLFSEEGYIRKEPAMDDGVTQSPSEKNARVVESSTFTGGNGMEEKLENAGGGLVFLCGVGGLVCLIVAWISFTN